MAMQFSLFLLSLLGSIHAAFTPATQCDLDHNLCVQQSQAGTICFYSTLTTPNSACDAPYDLPLTSHLKQNYAIGYYTASGQYLGRWNAPVPLEITPPMYVCMSARVGTGHYTLCARAIADDSWEPNFCSVNVAPATVSDGCYISPPALIKMSTKLIPTTATAHISPTSRITTSIGVSTSKAEVGTTSGVSTSPLLSTSPPVSTSPQVGPQVNTSKADVGITSGVSTSPRVSISTTGVGSSGTIPAISYTDSSTPSLVEITTTRDGTTLVLTTTTGVPSADSAPPSPSSTSKLSTLLKDSGYSIIWMPITFLLTTIRVGFIIKKRRSRSSSS